MSRLATPLFALLAWFAVSAPGTASACSCTNNLTLQQEFDFAAAVFSARVVQVEPYGDGLHVFVWLEPIARWKGGISSPLLVFTPANEGICGFPFVVDGEYLVFATSGTLDGAPIFFTHLCARTSPLEDNPHVPLLGPPLVPTGAAAPTWGAIKALYR